jgi:hypothetical protein
MPVHTAQAWFIVCITAGSGIFCTFIWHLFARSKARVVELDIRPPQSEALLRPPGHSLTEQLFGLIEQQDQKTSSAVLAALLASALLFPSLFLISQVVGAPELLSDNRVRWMTVGAVFGLFGAALCGYRAYAGGNELLALKKEMHARRGNIDHVVVGPGGVFIIETKTRSQQKPPPKKKRNRLWFDGAKTVFPSGYCEDSAPQVERHAEVMARWIRSIAPDAHIESLLVYPGWEVHLTQRCEGVKAMSDNQLRHYFRDLPSVLKPHEATAIRAMLDKRCRDVQM